LLKGEKSNCKIINRVECNKTSAVGSLVLQQMKSPHVRDHAPNLSNKPRAHDRAGTVLSELIPLSNAANFSLRTTDDGWGTTEPKPRPPSKQLPLGQAQTRTPPEPTNQQRTRRGPHIKPNQTKPNHLAPAAPRRAVPGGVEASPPPPRAAPCPPPDPPRSCPVLDGEGGRGRRGRV